VFVAAPTLVAVCGRWVVGKFLAAFASSGSGLYR